MEEDLIIEVWDTFKEYISEKNRNTAAEQYVEFLTGKDVENDVLEGLMGYDAHLDQAIELVLGSDKEETEDEDESFDDTDSGDEDY